MRARVKHFFKNPVYVLAALVSLAAVGVVSVFAMNASAAEVPQGFKEFGAAHLYYVGEADRAQIIYTAGYRTYIQTDLILSDGYQLGSALSEEMLKTSGGTKLTAVEGFSEKNGEVTIRLESSSVFVQASCEVDGIKFYADGDGPVEIETPSENGTFFDYQKPFDWWKIADGIWIQDEDDYYFGYSLNDYYFEKLYFDEYGDYNDAYDALYQEVIDSYRTEYYEEEYNKKLDSIYNQYFVAHFDQNTDTWEENWSEEFAQAKAKEDLDNDAAALEEIKAAANERAENEIDYNRASFDAEDLAYQRAAAKAVEALLANGKLISDEGKEIPIKSGLTYCDVFYLLGNKATYSATWETGHEGVYQEIPLSINRESGFSYSVGSVGVLKADSVVDRVRIVFYKGGAVCAEIEGKDIDCGDNQSDNGIEYILWCTSTQALLYDVDLQHLDFANTGKQVYLPISVTMTYDYSHYPEWNESKNCGWKDPGKLNGRKEVANNREAGFDLTQNLTPAFFTLGRGQELPTFKPINMNKECELVFWRVKNMGTTRYEPRDNLQLKSVFNYMEFQFNAGTGYYDGSFGVEPLFKDCYVSLNYHEQYRYSSYSGQKIDSDNILSESYIYVYQDEEGIKEKPELPTMTVKEATAIYSFDPSNENGHAYEKLANWNTDPDGTGTVYNEGQELKDVDNDIDLYAQWQALRYHIVYNYQSPTNSDGDVLVVKHDKEKWSECTTVDVPKEIVLSKDISQNTTGVYSAYTNSGFLHYGYNAGAYKTKLTPDSTGDIVSYDSIGLKLNPNTTNKNVEFLHWTKDLNAEDANSSIKYEDFKPIDAYNYEVTVYGVWDETTYNICYDANAGSDTVTNMPSSDIVTDTKLNQPDPQDSNKVIGVALSTQKPKRDNYAFVGWIFEPNGDDVKTHMNMDEAVALNGGNALTKGAAVTVYAKWRDARTVTYHANAPENGYSGTVPVDDTLYNPGDPAIVLGNNGDETIVPKGAALTRTGYLFAGWNTRSDGQGDSKKAGDTIEMVNNVDLYAQWTAITYRLTYDPNNTYLRSGVTVSGMPAQLTQEWTIDTFPAGGYSLSEAFPAAVGYNCFGWGDSASAATANKNAAALSDFKKNSQNATLYECKVYAVWSIIPYRLHYNANTKNGMDNVTYIEGQSVPPDKELDIRLFTLTNDKWVYSGFTESLAAEGFTFVGWNPDRTATTKADSLTLSENFANDTDDDGIADCTLYGIWTENEYKLHYDNDGHSFAQHMPDNEDDLTYGSSANDSKNIKNGKALSSNTPTDKGYTFEHWKLNDGTTLDPGDTVSYEKFKASATVTATAQWKPIQYSVTYDENRDVIGNEATVNDMPAPKTEPFNIKSEKLNEAKTEYTLSDKKPTTTGYVFEGWNTDKNATTGSAVLTFDPDAPDKDYTVYAIWSDYKYRLYYDLNGHDSAAHQPSPNPSEHLLGTVRLNKVTISESIPTDNGYTFMGWTIGSEEYPVATIVDGTKLTVPGTLFDENRSATAVAQWEKNYTLEFYDGDAKLDGTQTPDYAKDFTGIAITRDNLSDDTGSKEFLGWSLTKDATSASYSKGEKVEKEKFLEPDRVARVYAVWQENTVPQPENYTITYICEYQELDNTGALVTRQAEQVDMYEIDYTVRSFDSVVEEIQRNNSNFNVPADREFDSCQVTEGSQFVKLISDSSGGASPVSGGSSFMPRRSGASTVTKLYPNNKIVLHGNVKLTVIWNKYYVSYDAKGGTGGLPAEPTIYAVGSEVPVLANTGGLRRTGASFIGWNTASDYSGTRYKATGSETFTMPEKDVVLYAHWNASPNPDTDPTPSGNSYYTVTYDPNGAIGGDTPTDSAHYNGGETITVASKEDLVKTGCIFKEWNTARNGSGTGYRGDGTDSFTMPKSSVTLYAVWVDSDGNIVIPNTGENDLSLQIALNAVLLSVMAVVLAVMKKRQKSAMNQPIG